MRKYWIICLFFISASFDALSQESESNWLKSLDKIQFKPSLTLQFWTSYTFDQELYDEDIESYEPVSNRTEVQIRRSRLGFSVQPFSRLSIKFVSSIDFVGRDVLSATVGAANNGASPAFRLWQFTGQWQFIRESQAVFITAGYLSPQIGRESITGLLGSTGMEKVWVQNYVRRQLVGTGPGRASGINLGGLLQLGNDNFHLDYNLGLFSPVFHAFNGNSTGAENSPLLTGKVSFHIGDPESEKYSLGHTANYFSKRKGFTFGIQAAKQGPTDLFSSSQLVGFDLLFNWKHLNLDGEWHWHERADIFDNQDFSTSAQVGYIKISYNIFLNKKYMIEPVLMISTYKGEDELDYQLRAQQVGMPSGTDDVIDAGFNFYLSPKLKLSLHYTHNNGDLGQMPQGSIINNYFFQGGAGAIQRGNWIGFGIVVGI